MIGNTVIVRRVVSLDFTSSTAPIQVNVVRTGGTVYAQTSATAVTATTGTVFEDRGDAAGGGWWTFGSYTNAISTPFNHASGVVWTYSNAPTVTQDSAVAPDGTTTADTISQPGDGTQRDIYFGNLVTSANRVHSTWVKDASPAPSVAGGLKVDTWTSFAGGVTFGTGSSWRRVHASSNDTEQHRLTAAGYNPLASSSRYDNTQAGAVYAWGDQEIAGIDDLPLVTSASGNQTIQITDTPTLSNLIVGGDLDLEGVYVSRVGDCFGYGGFVPADFYVFSAETNDGALSLRFVQSTRHWVFAVRGVDVGFVHMGGFPDGQEVKFRVYYKPSTGKWGMRVTMNGALASISPTTGADNQPFDQSTTGSALAAPTSFWLGSNLGASGYLNGQWKSLRTYVNATETRLPAEFVLLGDSIVAQYTDAIDSGSAIYTVAEARTRAGVANQAIVGNRIADQKTKYNASAYKGAASVTAFVIQLGINNVLDGDSAATIEAALQDLVTTIHAGNPLARILLCQMIPAHSSLSAPQYAVWQAVNAWIISGTPTNVDLAVTANRTNLDDGSDSIQLIYRYDGIHPNIYGRQREAAGWRAGLVTLGLL